jgi:hypothetical protein
VNGSAKYDLEGNVAIITILHKKNYKGGIEGNIYVRVSKDYEKGTDDNFFHQSLLCYYF